MSPILNCEVLKEKDKLLCLDFCMYIICKYLACTRHTINKSLKVLFSFLPRSKYVIPFNKITV